MVCSREGTRCGVVCSGEEKRPGKMEAAVGVSWVPQGGKRPESKMEGVVVYCAAGREGEKERKRPSKMLCCGVQ